MRDEETQEMATTDEKLEEALAPINREYSEISITKEIFRKYCVPGATDAEVFFCMGKTRALGLDPLMPGYVHYIKFPGKPYDLFVGYPEYLKQAYDNGLEHLSYEFTKDEDGLLLSVITTLQIKGRDNPFVWETWYDEVVALTKEGVPNWRWQKAPRSQLRKCGSVDSIRYSGLLTINLPYIPDEMGGEAVAEGFRSIPQSVLDAHGVEVAELPEAKAGEVSADYHEDLHPLRKIYRGKLTERKIFPDDVQRKRWQSEIIGKASTSDWDAADFMNAVSEIKSGRAEQWAEDNVPKPEPDPPGGAKTEDTTRVYTNPQQMLLSEAEKRFRDTGDYMDWRNQITEKPIEDWSEDNYNTAISALMEVPLLAAQDATDDAGQENTQAEGAEGQEQPPLKISDTTKELIKEALESFGDSRYLTIKSMDFKKRAGEVIGGNIKSITLFAETEAVAVLESLLLERQEQLATERKAEEVKADLAAGDATTKDEPAPTEDTGMCTEDDRKELAKLFISLLPQKEYAMGSKEARDMIRDSKAIKFPKIFTKIKSMTTEETSDLKHYLKDLITDMEAKAEERKKNAKDDKHVV